VYSLSHIWVDSLESLHTKRVAQCRVAVCCSVLQCVAVCCSVLQCIPCHTWMQSLGTKQVAHFPMQVESLNFLYKMSCSIFDVDWVLQSVAECCSVLQCVAVCCSVLQYVAPLQNELLDFRCKLSHSVSCTKWAAQFLTSVECCRVLQSVAVCCSMLQCVAVCCSVLHLYKTSCSISDVDGVLQSVAVCCSVLLCVAVCCSVLHLYKTSRSISDVDGVLQGVAECCSVLLCVAVCCTFTKWGVQFLTSVESRLSTGWRKYRRCLKLHASFRKRASNYRVLSQNIN